MNADEGTGNCNIEDVSESNPAAETGTFAGTTRRILKKLSFITVEPVIFLFVVGYSLTVALTVNLLLERVCLLNYNGSAEDCANLTRNDTLQDAVVDTTAQINLYSSLVTNLPSLVIGPALGAYSDKYGRKIPLMMPYIGYSLSSIATMVFAYYPSTPAIWSVACAIPNGMMGGFIIILMAGYAHVSDNSSDRTRTWRMALLLSTMAVGAPCGLQLSDVLYRALGYWPVYAIAAALFALALLYVIVLIENVVLEQPARQERKGTRELVAGIRASLVTCFRSRPHYGRLRLLLLLLGMMCIVFSFGSNNFALLYTKKKFNFTYSEFIRYSMLVLFFDLIGSGLLLYVFSYRLKVHDSWLGLFSSAVRMVAYVVLGASDSTLWLYISAGLGCFGLMPSITGRSLVSKSIPATELGKVFSILSTGEHVIPIISNTAFTALFESTLTTMPGAIFYLAALVYAINTATFGFLVAYRVWGAPDDPATAPLLQEEEEEEEETDGDEPVALTGDYGSCTEDTSHQIL